MPCVLVNGFGAHIVLGEKATVWLTTTYASLLAFGGHVFADLTDRDRHSWICLKSYSCRNHLIPNPFFHNAITVERSSRPAVIIFTAVRLVVRASLRLILGDFHRCLCLSHLRPVRRYLRVFSIDAFQNLRFSPTQICG